MDQAPGTQAARRVALLPDALANQIAAGEVVERPASVVKELVENALDAGASRVFVDLEGAGQRLVRVVDDGCGMDRHDALLAVQRHATSKIQTSDDLAAILTLGFRGEALPSIASVSRFLLVTRPEDAPVGTEIRIDGGAAPQVRDAGGPVGTRIEVRDLFHNVPARLKFLKKAPTELGHVQGLMTAFALGYPYVHFRLTHGGRVLIDHPVAPSLEQRIFQVLGRQLAERMFPVRLEGPVSVMGCLSEPTCNRANQDGVHAFVNGRRVRDRVIHHALLSAYGNLLDRGRHPYAVLYLHVPPDEVDVNVHPTKAEVRFVRSGAIHEALTRACKVTLSSTPWLDRAPAPVYAPRPDLDASRALAVGEPTPATSPTSLPPTPLPMDVYGLSTRPARHAPPPPATLRAPVRAQELVFEEPVGRGYFSRMRVVGQVARTYLVCEDREGVYIIDQHAAHERVGYERIKAGFCTARLARQQLLIPLQLELSTAEAAALRDHTDTLERLGFTVEPFGGATWQIVTVPALLARAEPARLVRDIVAELVDIGHASLMQAHLDLLFSTMACHTVVRAGDTLSHDEIRELLRAMDEVDLGANCPHGRPVLVTLPFDELARRLHRK